MVTGKQPSPTEDARWDLRSSLGQRHRRKRRSTKVPVSCDRFCLPFKSSFSSASIRIDSALLLNSDPQMSVTHIHIHAHTHHNLQRFVVSEALARAPSGTCSFWGRKKRETRESHLGFSCVHLEVTQETPPMLHCPEWVTGVEIQLFDEYNCLSTSFSRTLESSVVSFSSPWRSFWGTAFCRDWTRSDPPRVRFEGILYLNPLAGVSLTPYSTSVCAKGD